MALCRVKIGDKNDNPPVFNLPHYTTTIEESSVIGKRVKQVYATDRDSGDNGRIEYFLDDDPSEFFVINQYSGWVSVARPMSGVSSVSLCLSILFTNLFFHDYHRSGHILGGLPGKTLRIDGVILAGRMSFLMPIQQRRSTNGWVNGILYTIRSS